MLQQPQPAAKEITNTENYYSQNDPKRKPTKEQKKTCNQLCSLLTERKREEKI